ncbi:MAG: CHASE domain-containing protein [Rubrobacteraceae bacterium]
MKPAVRGFLLHLRRAWIPYLVLLISVLLTLLAWRYVSLNVEEQNRLRFEETVNATGESVERITTSYIDAMFGGRALFYSSEKVERDEWSEYVRGLEFGDRLKGFQALGYAEYVPPAERTEFAGRIQEEGLPDLSPHVEPGEERSAYFPVFYVGPLDRANSRIVSNDLYTDPAQRGAMDRACDTGLPQATRMTYVLTGSDGSTPADLALRPGFAVFLPVYRDGRGGETAAERWQKLEGFVVGTFRMDGLLEEVFGEAYDPGIDLEVYDGSNVAESRLLYDEDGVQRATAPDRSSMFSEKSKIEVAGREWTLYFSTLDGFERNASSNLPFFVLGSGVLVSLLLFGATWLLVRSRTRAERAGGRLEDANRRLEDANRELEAFSYSVSHDLRAPLRTIDGFSRILLEDYDKVLDKEGQDYLGRVRNASQHMGHLIDDLLNLSQVVRSPLRQESVDLSALAARVSRELHETDPEREVEFVIQEDVTCWGDGRLLLVALENLLGNAWKFTRNEPEARIEFGVWNSPLAGSPTGPVYYVRDNGAGFDMSYAGKLFGAFQRLHGAKEFEGTGIGLATVQRIVHRHGGRVWAEGEVGGGAVFYFTLGDYRAESVKSKKKGQSRDE